MKTVVRKNQLAVILIAAVVFTGVFSSCGGGSKKSEVALPGTTWSAETDYANYLLTFHESTYEWTDLTSGELMDSGDYTVEGSLVHLVRQGGEFTDTYTRNGDELSIGENEDYKLFKKVVD